MYRDCYYPQAPILACCPHCALTIPGAPNYSPHMRRCLVSWDCPSCGGEWEEVRTSTTVVRFWDARRLVASPQ